MRLSRTAVRGVFFGVPRRVDTAGRGSGFSYGIKVLLRCTKVDLR